MAHAEIAAQLAAHLSAAHKVAFSTGSHEWHFNDDGVSFVTPSPALLALLQHRSP